MLSSTRRQTHRAIREAPRMVRDQEHSRSYRFHRMPSSMTTGTTTHRKVRAES